MDRISDLITMAIGEASVACCECPEKAGIFDSAKAAELAKNLHENLKKHYANVFCSEAYSAIYAAMRESGRCWENNFPINESDCGQYRTLPSRAAYRISINLCYDLIDVLNHQKEVVKTESKDWFKEAF